MHLEELEKLENEYNIYLSDQDKLYMIANKYTLVIHIDETYTLIKGHKIKDSCSGFKYIGDHSIEGKKLVDLKGHSLKGENILGTIYGVDKPAKYLCPSTVIDEDCNKYSINCNSYYFFNPITSGPALCGWNKAKSKCINTNTKCIPSCPSLKLYEDCNTQSKNCNSYYYSNRYTDEYYFCDWNDKKTHCIKTNTECLVSK